MKHLVAVPVLAAAGLAAAASGLIPVSAEDGRSRGTDVTQLARGEYLVDTIGCDDCHTPKLMTPEGPVLDRTRRLAGHREDVELPPPPAASGPWIGTGYWELTAWSGPWGISYATNLTPDENTGIGIWTEDMFVRTLREGRHMGASRPLLPPMPWQYYRNLNDEDLKAIFAFLRSLPATHNRVPLPAPPGEPPARAAAP